MPLLFRVRTVLTGVPGTPYYSNLYFDATGSTAQDAVNAVITLWGALAGSIVNDIEARVEDEVAVINDLTGDIVRSDLANGGIIPGTNSGVPLPWATQGRVALRTNVYAGGRRLQGRIFIPGPVASAMIDGAPVAGYGSTLEDAFGDLMDDPATTWVIWSRAHTTSAEVTSAIAAAEWGVLRSRRN